MAYAGSQPSRERPFLPRILPYVLMLLIGYLAAGWYGQWKRNTRLHDPDAKPRPITARGDLAKDEQTTIDLFSKNSAAVVFITTTTVQFDVFSFNETELSRGSGSGFVWNEDGHVVTNDHVISEADQAQVTLSDQSTWDAEIVGRAPAKDLAVLKIAAPPEKLRPIIVGSSNDLQVGQKVYAIGNPFGLDQTLTTGVISALEREITTNERTPSVSARRTIHGVIQTDAAINPGNSGGPLLDSAGRLIGVNTAIFSPSGAYAGVGFAIPVDTVNRIVPALIRDGAILRPSIGIAPFGDQMPRQLNVKGVLVKDVEPESPAKAVGIQATQAVGYQTGLRVRYHVRWGDLIIAANGKPIRDLNDWFTFLEGQRVGGEVTLTVIRDLRTSKEKEQQVRIRLERTRG